MTRNRRVRAPSRNSIRNALTRPGPERVAALVARRCALGLTVFMLALPLQWYNLGSSPLGHIRFFHIAAVAMVWIARPPWSSLEAAAAHARPIFPAAVVIVIVGTATSVGWHSGPTQYIQSGYYVFFGLVAAGCLIIALTDQAAQRILALAGPATLALFMLALLVSARHAGVSVPSAVGQALGGDTHALEFRVFKAAFQTAAADARSNLRHEIFGAVAVTTYVGLVAASRSGYYRKTNAATALAAAVLVVLSLSRSVTLAVALTAVIGLARIVATNRLKPVTVMAGLVGFAVVPFALSKALTLLSSRFQETQSYDSRIAAVGQLSNNLAQTLFVGGPMPDTATQNLVLDAIMRAGLVAGVAALVIELVVVTLTLRAIGLYFRTGRVQALAAVGAAMQLFIRSLTGGQNLMHEVEWFALAVLLAVLHAELGPARIRPLRETAVIRRAPPRPRSGRARWRPTPASRRSSAGSRGAHSGAHAR